MEKVRVNADYTIKLPEKIRKSVNKNDELIISLVEDILRLKKIKKKSILVLAAEIEDESQPSSEELNRIIHQLRKTN